MRTELYGHVIDYDTQEELSEKIQAIRANQIPKHLRKKFASKLELTLQSESAVSDLMDPKVDEDELTETELLDRLGDPIIFPIDYTLYAPTAKPEVAEDEVVTTPKLEGDEVNSDTVPEFTMDADGNPVLTNPEAPVTPVTEPTAKTEDVKPSATKQVKRK